MTLLPVPMSGLTEPRGQIKETPILPLWEPGPGAAQDLREHFGPLHKAPLLSCGTRVFWNILKCFFGWCLWPKHLSTKTLSSCSHCPKDLLPPWNRWSLLETACLPLGSQFHSCTKLIVKCIYLSRNWDNSWQGYHSVSPGNAKLFVFTLQALCWVTWESRWWHGCCPVVQCTCAPACAQRCSPPLALPKAPPSSYRATLGSNGCGSCVCLLRRQWGRAPTAHCCSPQPGQGQALEWLAHCWNSWPSARVASSVPCASGTDCSSPGLRSLTVVSGHSSFAVCQQLVAMMALFLILFFRKESELSPKGFCLSDTSRLQIRLELLFHVPLHADCLLVFSLWLSGPVAHHFVFSHFIFLTMISSLSSAKHLHSDSQTIYLELSGTCVNQDMELCGVSVDKGKGIPCSLFKASV